MIILVSLFFCKKDIDKSLDESPSSHSKKTILVQQFAPLIFRKENIYMAVLPDNITQERLDLHYIYILNLT